MEGKWLPVWNLLGNFYTFRLRSKLSAYSSPEFGTITEQIRPGRAVFQLQELDMLSLIRP